MWWYWNNSPRFFFCRLHTCYYTRLQYGFFLLELLLLSYIRFHCVFSYLCWFFWFSDAVQMRWLEWIRWMRAEITRNTIIGKTNTNTPTHPFTSHLNIYQNGIYNNGNGTSRNVIIWWTVDMLTNQPISLSYCLM